jgi:hypothetical protein
MNKPICPLTEKEAGIDGDYVCDDCLCEFNNSFCGDMATFEKWRKNLVEKKLSFYWPFGSCQCNNLFYKLFNKNT